jgi:hypothetical protein
MGAYPTVLEQRLAATINKLDRRVSLLEVANSNPSVIGGVLAQQQVQSPDYDPVAATGWGLTSAGSGLLQNITIIHQPTPSNQLVGDDATMTSSIGGWTAMANCQVGYGLAPDNVTECLEMTIGAQSGAPAVMGNPTFFAIPVAAGDIITVSAKWWAPASGLTVQHAIMFADQFGGPITGGTSGLLGGTYSIDSGAFSTITDTVTVPSGATQLLGLQATVYGGATNQVLYNAAWTVQDASANSPGGLFVYGSTPKLGTPPIFAAVAPNVTVDTFGNNLINSVGQIPNATVIVGSSMGPQIFLEPEAGIVFGAGILETVLRLSSGDANELMDGLVSAMIANQGAANQQMAIVLAAPAPVNTAGNSCALVLTANSDDNTIAAALTFGVVTTDGESETFNPVAVLNDNGIWQAQTYIAYAEGVQPVIVVFNSHGSHTWTPPVGVAICKGEGWAAGGGGGGTDSTGQQWAGGGGAGGEYSCEPSLVVTPLVGVSCTVGTAGTGGAPGSNGGTGGNTTIVGTSVTVTAHGGTGGVHGTSAGLGANGIGGNASGTSTNTIHFPGGNGGPGAASGGGYNFSGGGGAAGGTAVAGQAGSALTGGVGVDDGGDGGNGTTSTNPNNFPTAGGTPGGGGGGQTIAGKTAAAGAVGMTRITYTPPTNVPVASASGVATVDPIGNPVPAGLYGTVTLPPQTAVPTPTMASSGIVYANAKGTPCAETVAGFAGALVISQTDFTVFNVVGQTSLSQLTKIWAIPIADAQIGTFYRLTAGGTGTWGNPGNVWQFGLVAFGVANLGSIPIGASQFTTGLTLQWRYQAEIEVVNIGAAGTAHIRVGVSLNVAVSGANQLTSTAGTNQEAASYASSTDNGTTVATNVASNITLQAMQTASTGGTTSCIYSIIERGGA